MVLTVLQCGNIVTTVQHIRDSWLESGCPNKFWGDFYDSVSVRVRNSDHWVVYDADARQGYGFRYKYDALLFMRFWRGHGDFCLFSVSELV
jgi:hypothetical protein